MTEEKYYSVEVQRVCIDSKIINVSAKGELEAENKAIELAKDIECCFWRPGAAEYNALTCREKG